MAGSKLYTAILDANVLYPFLVRDVLLSLAHQGLYHARWSKQIQDEWVRNLRANRPDLDAPKFRQMIAVMEQAIPDSLICESYQSLIAGLQLPDPDDRHVLAAAIAGHADVIVTFNLKDFPVAVLSQYGIEARHPDDFVLDQLELRPLEALAAIKAMRARWRNPPKTFDELIDMLQCGQLPLTASHLNQAQDLI